jgi:hypothetical protein
MNRLVLAGVLTVCIAGCATSSMQYSPPNKVSIVNSTKIAKPFDVVWDQLVRELSSDFFVINNIDKNSRLINISFSTNRPSDYIDCGRTVRAFNGIGGDSSTYNAADSARFNVTNRIGQVFNVQRTTKLTGRANIYVAPESPGTSVIVNTKYVLDINSHATSLDGKPAGQSSSSVDFSTKTSSDQTANGPACSTKGVIEQKILAFVNQQGQSYSATSPSSTSQSGTR